MSDVNNEKNEDIYSDEEIKEDIKVDKEKEVVPP